VLLILTTSIGCDRATKVVAESALEGRGRLSYLGDVFRLEYVRNTGAFLSLGSTLQEPLRTVLLQGFVAVLVTGLVAFALVRGRRRAQVAALALVAGGGHGQPVGRLLSGAVTDFMNLGIGPVRTGVFNVADIAIMVGVGHAHDLVEGSGAAGGGGRSGRSGRGALRRPAGRAAGAEGAGAAACRQPAAVRRRDQAVVAGRASRN
jgi:signal peptidase II